MYRDGEANLDFERREVCLSLLSDDVVAAEVPSLTAIMMLMVPLSEKEVFLESEGRRNCRCGYDVSTFVPKRPGLLVLLRRLGHLSR